MKSTEEFLKDMFMARRAAMGGKSIGASPPQRLVISFAVIIALGAFLLLLPWSVPDNQPISIMDAAFTATSAVCVTGLIVRDTASAFTPFGQVVIALLIKVGGLGYMILATLAAVLLGRRIGVNERATIKQALNLDTAEGMGKFLRSVLIVGITAELIGAIVISLAYWESYPPLRAIALGVFHSISGFNNAGFSLFSNNLMGEGARPLVVGCISALVLFGGLGFFVIREFMDIANRKRNRLSQHTKLVLIATFALLLVGFAGIWMTAQGSWQEALFLSISSRTAGFNIQDTGRLATGTLFFLMPLMFIGASPGGTGGGIKTTTFSIMLLSVWNTLRGRQDVVAFKRQIMPETIFKAMMIIVTMGLILVMFTLFLVVWENKQVIDIAFEVTSALGTVGLSTGNGGNLSLSASFSGAGKAIIIVAMFIGRLGPLTLGLAAAYQSQHPQLKYPEGRVSIG
ncbi:hypothetical protein K8S19_07000 [bacterium]|nr:hypothetical protein [bacterium]